MAYDSLKDVQGLQAGLGTGTRPRAIARLGGLALFYKYESCRQSTPFRESMARDGDSHRQERLGHLGLVRGGHSRSLSPTLRPLCIWL